MTYLAFTNKNGKMPNKTDVITVNGRETKKWTTNETDNPNAVDKQTEGTNALYTTTHTNYSTRIWTGWILISVSSLYHS